MNSVILQEALDAAGIPTHGVDSSGTISFKDEATEAQHQQAAGIVAAHNPAGQTTRQQGAAQLVAFLDSRQADMQYADYFYRLQKRLLDLWRDKPNASTATTEIYAALRANRDSDVNHLAMYNVFLWMLPKITGVALVSGDLPASPTAAQAQQINMAAYVFAMNGVTMANMLLLNQRG